MPVNLITLTKSAEKHIANVLSREPEGTALRITISGGGCSGFQYNFEFDTQRAEEDFFLEQEGARILIDPLSLRFLENSQIEFVEDLTGQSLQIVNPNASSSCGCGSSFSV